MKTSVLSQAIRDEFLKNNTRPGEACTAGRSGGVLDERRWDGRSADSCLKKWNIMRNECSAYRSAQKQIEAVELTSPTVQYVERCVLAFYNNGSDVTSHLYDIIRNPKYVIGR